MLADLHDGRMTQWHNRTAYAWALPVPDGTRTASRLLHLTRAFAVQRRSLPAVNGMLWLVVAPSINLRSANRLDADLREEYKNDRLGFNPLAFSRLFIAANNAGIDCDPNKLINVLRRAHTRGGYVNVH